MNAKVIGLILFLSLFPLSSLAAYRLPDTGQTKCYQPVSPYAEISCAGTGQDGAYNINPLSYTDIGNGTVTDKNTGLMWQKCSVGQNNDATCSGTATSYNWYQASGTYDATSNPSSQNICGSLSWGGYTDWRLPTKKELMGIIDYSIPYPGSTIRQAYFPNTVASDYWSSTTYADNPGNAWDVDFSIGDVLYVNKSIGVYVRCVRGGQQDGPVLSGNGNGTVTDNRTGLIWQQGEPGYMTWGNALSYCEGLSLGGSSDWRLPNVKELESLTNDSLSFPAIDTAFFPNAYTSYYWSSTSLAGYSESWYVSVSYGFATYISKDGLYYVRCVSGGQSGASVYSISGNTGVSGATVTLTGGANMTITGAADGSYIFTNLVNGSYTVTPTLNGYAFSPASQNVTVNSADVMVPVFTATENMPPIINSVTLPVTPTTCNVPVTIDATDNVGIAGYYLSENSATPGISDSGWSTTLPTSYSFAGPGSRTLYVWVKDAAGNLSARGSATTTIVGVARIGAVEYCSLNDAYNAALPSGETTIWTLGTLLNESLAANKLLILIGGFNTTYSGRTVNPTELKGILVIGKTGKLTVDRLSVR